MQNATATKPIVQFPSARNGPLYLTWLIVNCCLAELEQITSISSGTMKRIATERTNFQCILNYLGHRAETPRPWQFDSIPWQGIWLFWFAYVWAENVDKLLWITLTLCSRRRGASSITYSPKSGLGIPSFMIRRDDHSWSDWHIISIFWILEPCLELFFSYCSKKRGDRCSKQDHMELWRNFRCWLTLTVWIRIEKYTFTLLRNNHFTMSEVGQQETNFENAFTWQSFLSVKPIGASP